MITVEIITPERSVRTMSGSEVLLPTTEGILGIRKGHLPLIAILKPGEVVVKQDNGSEEVFVVIGGFVEVVHDTVNVMADTAEHASDLNEEKVQQAIERAQQLKATATERTALADASAQLEAQIARLKAIQRKKAHHHTHRAD